MRGHRSRFLRRRDVLTVGAGAFGLTLPKILEGQTSARTGHPDSPAKSVVILYLSGGPSQLDMWDMKPHASEEIRGTFQPIDTSVPGIRLCEHMPRMARLADKYTIVRSMSHDESDHLRAGYWVMTGARLARPVGAFSGMSREDRPHVGAIVSQKKTQQDLPAFVVVPEYVMPREVPRPGQHAGFLGARFDPYLIHSNPNSADYDPGAIRSINRMSSTRIQTRRELLDAFENRSRLHTDGDFGELDGIREAALNLVSSAGAQRAFDISKESDRTRDRYGRHVFGQSALVARRLIEAGVRLVQVNFPRHDNGMLGQGYDSHSVPPFPPHLEWAKDELLPPTDAAFAALMEDLSDRGLLEETIVVMMGEFGRTPRFNNNGGRDHWPDCYSVVIAGGGFVGGRVFGASDKIAAAPLHDPVSPNDLLATIYHLLGIDYRESMYDLEERPHAIVDGTPVMGLLS